VRQSKLRKLRVLMFKHEMRAKHIKKIKSRAFHKANKKKKGNAGTPTSLRARGCHHPSPPPPPSSTAASDFP
jgi:hypothetical protein